jgi:D-threo-aldose 1-dehydrogenase
VKPIGLGTSPLGGLFSELDEATARATVDRAWGVGIRHFDTAPLYGSGLSERRLGSALRARPRDEFVLSTKVGKLLVPGPPDPLFKGALPFRAVPDFSPEG